MSENFRPNYNSYRDESRDPRVRSATNEQQSNSKSRLPPPASVAASRSSRPLNEVEINERLREIQNERDHVSSCKGSELPIPLPATMTPPLKSTSETRKITTVSRKLNIDEDLSNPFTCNLMIHDGKRCVKAFSGVGNVMIKLISRFPASKIGDVTFRKYIINLGLEDSSRWASWDISLP